MSTETAIEIATIRIELRGSKPKIWRSVEVPTSITLKNLHDVIQAAMGWADYHLWEFVADGCRFGLPSPDDWGGEPVTDARKTRLHDLLGPRKTTIDYIYDFGDYWEHRLTVSDVRPGDPALSYPRYVAGERNAPPDDCGGLPGFYETLKAARDPKHPNHQEAKYTVEGYDPNEVDELPIVYGLQRIANRIKPRAARKPRKPAAADV